MVSSFLFIFAGMEKIYNYYQDIVTAYTRRADNLKKKIHLLGSIRLLLVVLVSRMQNACHIEMLPELCERFQFADRFLAS